MKYQSTRGNSKILTFEEAVLQGLSPDGGLYIPLNIPKLSIEEINAWKDLKFHELAAKLYRLYIAEDEISTAELSDLCRRSFETFSHSLVTPVNKLPTGKTPSSNTNLDNLWILELFHGPTFAFKDVALQFLGNLFEFFLARKNAGKQERSFMTVVGATSGDTGGAAIYGLRGKKDIDVFILHPHNRISKVQELQMTTVLDHNVYNIALEGSFDDCQDIVKELFSNKEFKDKYQLGAINSINWARILAQTTYYFYSYFQIQKQCGHLVEVQYSVPTGNFGDILAGFYAQQMGLPIAKLIVATNENDILDRFFKTGHYDKCVRGNEDPVKQTCSPAMDILVSSNFERLLFYLVQKVDSPLVNNYNQDDGAKASSQLNEYMTMLKNKGGFSVDGAALARANELFVSNRVSDVETKKCIDRYYHEKSSPIVLDPHTAVGVEAVERYLAANPNLGQLQTICLSTASPGKFPEVILDAIPAIKPEAFTPTAILGYAGRPQRITFVKTGGDKRLGLERVQSVIHQTIGK